MSIKVGDRVQFRAGRGYALGRVANIDSSRTYPVAVIATDAGKKVNRLLSAVTLVLKTEIVETEKAEAAAEPAVVPCVVKYASDAE